MDKYRKKPVVIRAMQFKWNKQKELVRIIGENLRCALDPKQQVGIMTGIVITLEGNPTAVEGGNIKKGVKGGSYPVTPWVFYETYEEVKDR